MPKPCDILNRPTSTRPATPTLPNLLQDWRIVSYRRLVDLSTELSGSLLLPTPLLGKLDNSQHVHRRLHARLLHPFSLTVALPPRPVVVLGPRHDVLPCYSLWPMASCARMDACRNESDWGRGAGRVPRVKEWSLSSRGPVTVMVTCSPRTQEKC